MIRIDLHTHSYASPDGGISLKGYQKALKSRLLSFVAITDHNTIKGAQSVHEILGDRIIVGEEIKTTDGEIIGLYLTETIPAGLSAKQTIAKIREQGGLVYIPHPFETMRKGISEKLLQTIAADVDIIEINNGRAYLQNRTSAAKAWSRLQAIAGASSSDAHNYSGLGRTFTVLAHPPTRGTLVELLASATHQKRRPSVSMLTAPKRNRLKKLGKRS